MSAWGLVIVSKTSNMVVSRVGMLPGHHVCFELVLQNYDRSLEGKNVKSYSKFYEAIHLIN